MTHVSLVRRLLLVAVAASGLSLPPGHASGQEHPSPVPVIGGASAWLSGPFGRVAGRAVPPGADLASPAPHDAGGERPLDTVVRSARLVLELEHPAGIVSWQLAARSMPDGAETALARGTGREAGPDGMAVPGPARPARYVLEARVVAEDGTRSALAWDVTVPDMQPPPGGIPDLVPPAIELRWEGGRAEGWLGNGCYVYDCVDVGPRPPLALLDTARPRPGEPLVFRLSDGSPVVSWSAMALSTTGETAHSEAPAGGPFPEGVLRAPAAGAWLVTIRYVMDRERGWFESHFLVEPQAMSPSPPPQGQRPAEAHPR
jgi:hypothetical protein